MFFGFHHDNARPHVEARVVSRLQTRGGNCSSIRRTLPPKRQQIITSTDRSRTGKWEKFMKTWTNWWMMLKRGLLQKIVISLPAGSTFCHISGRQLLKWVAITLLNKLFIVLLFILLKIVGKVAANKKTTLIFHQPNSNKKFMLLFFMCYVFENLIIVSM